MRRININWATILTFVSLWSYGIFGFLTFKSWSLETNLILSIALLIVFLYVFKLRKKESFFDHIDITKKDVTVFVYYFLILLVLSFNGLSQSIDGDQLYHSEQAMKPALTVVNLLSNHFSLLDNLSAINLVWVVNILFLFAGIFLYFIFRNKSEIYKIFSLGFLFIISRFSVLFLAGNAIAFPSFRLFPIWVSGLIFLDSEFSFRMATFIGLVLLMCFIYRKSSKVLSESQSFLFGLFVGTIPVLLHVGNLVELSIWASICFTFVLFTINDWANGENINYIKVISIITIFSLMRISSFITLAPIFVMMFFDFRKGKISKKEIIYSLSILLVLLPVVFASVYIGTPSTYPGDVSLNPYIPAHAPLLQRLWVVLKTGSFVTYVYNSIRFPLLAFLVILPILLLKNFKKLALTGLLFVFGFILFYSINPAFWGHGRYQAEYIVPFIVFGAYACFLFLSEKFKYTNIFIIFFIICNIYLYLNISNMNASLRGQGVYSVFIKNYREYFVLSEFPYDSVTSLKEAKKDGYAGEVYYAPGNGYGYFSEILSGYSVAELKKEKLIISSVGDNLDNITAREINENKDIKLVIVNGSEKDRTLLPQKLADDLRVLGWANWKEFYNDKYGTTIYGLIRNN